jgi:predicted O-linked N-acetylglucosamine transferase (SPINDLY family)
MNKLKALQIALDSSPNDVQLINELGCAFHRNGDLDKAAFEFCRAIEIAPNYAPAYSNLGLLFKKTKRFEKAKECLGKAISLRPDVKNLYNDLASILSEMGQVTAAQALIEKALKIDPSCLQTYSHFLFTAIHNANNSPQQCFQYAKRFGELAAQAAMQKFSHFKKSPQSRLRVGFVSGDLRRHPVSYFLEPIFQELSKQDIELLAYPTTFQEDEVSVRLKNYFSHWKPLTNLDDKTAATLIYQDEVQILFDLSGHSANNRLPVFAFKPAPIQVSWLGYPATTGLQEMDFYLVDEDWYPLGMMDDLFVEKVLRLPVTAGSFVIPENIPDVNTLPFFQNGYFTFGSFNHSAKLSAQTLDLWCEVLNEIADAKMLLGNTSEKSLQVHLTNEFKKRGVQSERLIFQPRLQMQEYLKLHHQVDLILDTSPYAGGTTSAFAILMGVPVLTLARQSLVSRVGVTILSCAEIEKEFVAYSTVQFIELATHWVNNTQTLQELRLQLRERVRNNAKCNPHNVSREIEELLKQLCN